MWDRFSLSIGKSLKTLINPLNSAKTFSVHRIINIKYFLSKNDIFYYNIFC